MLLILKIFLFGFLLDIFYVLYVLAVQNKRTIAAGIFSVLLAAPALFSYLDIVHATYLAIPYLLGLFCGTITGMFLEERIGTLAKKIFKSN